MLFMHFKLLLLTFIIVICFIFCYLTAKQIGNPVKFYGSRDSNPSKMSRVIAVGQMNATADKVSNWAQVQTLVIKSVEEKAEVLFLPEGCDYIANNKSDSLNMAEEINGQFVSKLRKLAELNNLWISAGGVHIKSSDACDGRLSNTHILIDNRGNIQASYAKTHLFSTTIPGASVQEQSYVKPGQSILPPVSTPVGNVGLAICYDLRFPELSQALRRLGAHVITFPSAFTQRTGEAHWHCLLRARAIETQCYVVAAAQCGEHNEKRSSYGHALIVNPWGEVIADAGPESVDIITARVDLDKLFNVRKQMPCMSHSRQDLVAIDIRSISGSSLLHLIPNPSETHDISFGSVNVPGNAVFLHSYDAFAFSNLYPRTFGHSLVGLSSAIIPRFSFLTFKQLSAMAQMTVTAHRLACKTHDTTHCEVALQDGPASGQSIQDVHIHLLPTNNEGTVLAPDVDESKIKKLRQDLEHAMVKHAQLMRSNFSPSQVWCEEDVSQWCPKEVEFDSIDDGSTDASSGDNTANSRAICLKTKHCNVFSVYSEWQKVHIVITLRRSIETLNYILPHEAVDLFATAQIIQHAFEGVRTGISSTFVVSPRNENFDSVHLHVLPWLVEKKPSDAVYDYVAKFQLSAKPQSYEALAVREAVKGNFDKLSDIFCHH